MTQKLVKKIGLNDESSIDFLFDISKQVKHFYETSVIFITRKDYSDDIFNTLCSIRLALQNECETDIYDIIVNFHLKWLCTINDIEQFSTRINDITRDEMYQAISYTIDALSSRYKYYQSYIAKYLNSFSNENQLKVNADCEIIKEMHREVTKSLLNKFECFKNVDSYDDFKIKINDVINDLSHWIDNIYDSLAMLLCKYINMHVPNISRDLPKTLQHIVDDFENSKSPAAQKLLSEYKAKGKKFETMTSYTAEHNLEINKVIEKINKIENRIYRLENEPTSAALLALNHKKEYLEKTLSSLENPKIIIKDLQRNTKTKLEKVNDEDLCICDDYFQFRIFNHDLPPDERKKLVTELCHVWDKAVFGERGNKSIISILSATEVRDQYIDDIGTFHIDEYSRKIYKIPDDETFYQVNEQGKLVPITDDAEHVYFYDECGRYYIDQETKLRVYKNHINASEYLLDNSGILLKLKEERDGVVYYYDNFGRYYINEEGNHIYREADSMSEYENDGLGNLVRIKSHSDVFEPCPADSNVTADSKYLQLTVGNALRQCIANVVLHQPVDPIKYLSQCLVKYRVNIDRKEKENKEKEELEFEREIKIAEEQATVKPIAIEGLDVNGTEGGSENTYDLNLINYTTMLPEDMVSNETNLK